MNRDLTRRLLAAGPVLGLLLVGLAFGLAEPAFASQRNLVTIQSTHQTMFINILKHSLQTLLTNG